MMVGMDRIGPGAHLREINFATIVRQPRDLKWTVAFDQSSGVVVDRLAGAREESRRGIVVAQNQMRIRFGSLQRDADSHLANRAAGEAGRARDRLRAEEHVNAKCSSLADKTIEQ